MCTKKYMGNKFEYIFFHKSEKNNMNTILNSTLKWDGKHIGKGTIVAKWTTKNNVYHGILCKENNMVVYGVLEKWKSNLVFIVDDIIGLFGLEKRGIHRIKINKVEYILFYVPFSLSAECIWEPPVSWFLPTEGRNLQLPTDQAIKDPDFVKEMQKLYVVMDILGISHINEKKIAMRSKMGETYRPLNQNEYRLKNVTDDICEFSKHGQRWFPGPGNSKIKILYECISHTNMGNYYSNIVISSILSTKIEKIIKYHDNTWIWYGSYIMDRIMRYFLI